MYATAVQRFSVSKPGPVDGWSFSAPCTAGDLAQGGWPAGCNLHFLALLMDITQNQHALQKTAHKAPDLLAVNHCFQALLMHAIQHSMQCRR